MNDGVRGPETPGRRKNESERDAGCKRHFIRAEGVEEAAAASRGVSAQE
jgi:hypothetical protein